jgi:hypothetical protein
MRALEELGAFCRQLAMEHKDDHFDRREAIGALVASSFVPETVPAIKRAFLEAVQNIEPSHLDDDRGNTLLRNRCEVLITKLRMDHSDESGTIRELERALAQRVSEWDESVATENRITLWVLGPVLLGVALIALFACCGGGLGLL